jgi:hypothetical protein
MGVDNIAMDVCGVRVQTPAATPLPLHPAESCPGPNPHAPTPLSETTTASKILNLGCSEETLGLTRRSWDGAEELHKAVEDSENRMAAEAEYQDTESDDGGEGVGEEGDDEGEDGDGEGGNAEGGGDEEADSTITEDSLVWAEVIYERDLDVDY